MRVKILTSCAGRDFSYYEGEVVDVSAKLGKDLIKAGYAEKTTAPKTSTQSASSSASGSSSNAPPDADSEVENDSDPDADGGKCGSCKC